MYHNLKLLSRQIKADSCQFSYVCPVLTQEERNRRIAAINQLQYDFDVIFESLQLVFNYE